MDISPICQRERQMKETRRRSRKCEWHSWGKMEWAIMLLAFKRQRADAHVPTFTITCTHTQTQWKHHPPRLPPVKTQQQSWNVWTVIWKWLLQECTLTDLLSSILKLLFSHFKLSARTAPFFYRCKLKKTSQISCLRLGTLLSATNSRAKKALSAH